MSTTKSAGTPKTDSASKTSGSSKSAMANAFGESEFASQSFGADLSRRLDDPQSLPKDDILHLQRMVGNQAVANLLARKASSAAPAIGTEGGPVTSDIEEGISRARGSGSSLGKGVKSQMENGFGADFSNVRVHTGPEADTLNQSMQARAFTTGKDIFFKKGAYNPHSGDGRKLLAHELTHVVQQGGAGKAQRKPKLQRKLKVGPAKDRYEEEADKVASSVMRAQRTVQRSSKGISGGVIQRNLKDKFSDMGKNIKTSISNTKTKIITSPTYQKVTTKLNQLGVKLGQGSERVGSEMTNKSAKIVGIEDKKSIWSRSEAAKTLDMPVDVRVSTLREVFASEKDPTSAFKRVAFLLEGRVTGSIEAAYDNAPVKPPKPLRQQIADTFTNRPHKYSGDYLLNVLDNNGRAELKARIWLTLGLVDSPAVDETRLVELAERANFTKFKAVWLTIKDEVQKRAGIKTFNRLEAYIDAKEKGEQIESTKQSGGTVAPTDREALSAARDKHLATIVAFRRKELGKKAKMGLKALKLITMIPMLAAAKPVPMMINAIANTVDTQELSDDILKWRKMADQEDVDYIKTKGTASEFEKALAALPRVAVMRLSNLRGVTEAEVEYFKNLAIADIGPGGDDVAKESKLKSTAVFNAIKREQAANGQGKFGKGRAKVAKKVRAKMGAGKWDELAPQILEMTKEQRTEFLNQFTGTTPEEKLNALKGELDKAGIGEDKAGPIVALFENQHGEAGPGYLALVDYVTQQTKMKSKFGKFKRAVASPTKKGQSSKFAKKVIKLVSELRGNEFAQVRQSKTLLADIEANSGDKWYAIMRMLGVTSSTDQLTGTTEENLNDAQKKAEQSPEYWATQIEMLAVKTGFRSGSYDYTPPPTTQPLGKNGKPQAPKTPKAVKIKKIKFEEISWLIIRAQSVAHQVEDETSGNPTAAEFMLRIYDALQPDTQEKLKKDATTTSTKEDDIEKADKLGKIHLALTDQAKHPLNAKEAVKKTLKKAETKWYKVLWRPRPDRVRIVNSFSKLEGKELLTEWSNFEQYEGLYEGASASEQKIQDLNDKISDKRKEITSETDSNALKKLNKELDVLTRRRDITTEHRMMIQGDMKSFVLGIRADRYAHLLKMRALTSDDRLKIIAMLTEKIIAASESDPEIQMKMLITDLSFDEWMKAKMRGVDAIEMQRHLDTTRQWHFFSNKSSQLDEGTRRVVGVIRSGNEEMREAEKSNKSEDELQALKSKYSNRAQEEISDRKQVEAAFRDMQAKFNARASLIIRIITTILITAISAGISAASMGIATPIMIAINAGLLLSQVAIHAAFDYFVLKKPITQVALEAGVAILQMALTLLTMNLGTAMNASFLHPDLFLKGSEWIAPNLSKALSKTILGIAMAYPKTVMKMAYEQQPLEEAVAKGKEKAMGKALGKAFLMGAAKPWMKFVLKGGIGGVMYGTEQLKTPVYEGIYGSPPPTTESGGTNGGTTNQVTTPMPTGQQFLSDPGGSISQTVTSGQESVEGGIKGALTPKPTTTPPQRGFLETFVDPQTTKDNLDTMIKKQKKKIKKEAKKGAVSKGSKGGWLSSTTNTEQSRKEGMEGNRQRIVKGMRLVTGSGTSTRLSTSVTTLTTDVRVVYFGGGWRLEDTGSPKTATLNGQPVTRAMPLTPGDRVAVGSTQYSVELGTG